MVSSMLLKKSALRRLQEEIAWRYSFCCVSSLF